MGGRRWTRDELIALAGGRRVSSRNLQAADVDPPAWLLPHSDGRWPYNSSESLDLIHPDDRGLLVQAFLDSAIAPGEPVTVRLRSSSGGVWHHSETTWVNLVDDEDVGCMLAFISTVDGPPIDAPHDEAAGDHAPTRWMVWALNETGFVTSAEGASGALLGCEPDEIVGRHTADFIPPESVADGIAMWVDLHERGPGSTAFNRRPWLRADGTRIWLEDSYLKRPGRLGEDDAVLVVLWDATDQIAQEKALREREEQLRSSEAEAAALAAQMQALAADFRLLADEVPDAVFRCDVDGKVDFHNARWADLVSDRGAITRLHDLVADDDHPALDAALAELASAGTTERRSLEVGSSTDDRRWQLTLRSLGDREHAMFMGSLDDVTLEAELRHEASHDPLTGLVNRAGVEVSLTDALTDDPEATVVLFVDLDGFKQVNDTYGHPAGDAVLIEVGRRLRAGVRPQDVVARYGGDEFVVVGRDAGSASADHLVDRLMIALGGAIAFPGGTWFPRASIGTARGRAGDDIRSLIDRADQAMFDEKRRRKSAQQS